MTLAGAAVTLAVFVSGLVAAREVASPPSIGAIFPQLGHGALIRSVSFSPDGTVILSGDEQGVLVLWDVSTGRELHRIAAHSKSVTSLAVLPDGRRALSGSGDRTLKLWDLWSGAELREFSGAHAAVLAVAVAPTGELAFSGHEDNTAIVWDVSTGTEIRRLRVGGFPGGTTGFRVAAFSPDGTRILTGGDAGVLKLWEVSTGREFRTFDGHSGTVGSVAFLPDGRSAVTAGNDGLLKLWDVERGIEVGTLSDNVSEASLKPDGTAILTIARNGVSPTQLRRLDGTAFGSAMGPEAQSVHFAPAGTLAVAISGTEMTLFDAHSGKQMRTLAGRSRSPNSVAVSGDGGLIITGTRWGHTVSVWDAVEGRRIRTLRDPRLSGSDGWTQVAVSPDGTRVVSGATFDVAIWDISSGQLLRLLQGHKTFVDCVAFSPDGRYVVSVDMTTVKVWDGSTGRQVRSFGKERRKGVYVQDALCDGKYVGSMAWSGRGDVSPTFVLRDAMSGKSVQAFTPAQGGRAALSRDGRQVVIGGMWGPDHGRQMTIWEVSTGRMARTLEGHTEAIDTFAFSPDGLGLASGAQDGTIRTWNVGTGANVQTLRGHTGHVVSVSYSANGRHLLSAGDDRTTRVWDVMTGRELVKLVSIDDNDWVTVTPEGHFNASEGGAPHLNVRSGRRILAIDQFFERFFRPDIVSEVLAGGRPTHDTRPIAAVAMPPVVSIVSPRSGEVLSAPDIEVVVNANDGGGGVDEIRLFQNGKAVGESKGERTISRVGPAIRVGRFRTTLVEGDNVFRAVAFSTDRVESNAYEATVRLSAPVRHSTLRALVIGVNRYKNAALNLEFAVPDARAMAEFFRRSGTTLFQRVDVATLYDDEATRENVVGALQKIALQAGADDVVVIYLAGHGDSHGDTWYFIPWELVQPENPAHLAAGAISSDVLSAELLRIRALKQLLLIDSCRSGRALPAFRGVDDRKALFQLARARGVHVIAASTAEQNAAEIKELGHGIFTYLLLKGLSGEAVLKSVERAVSVRSLMAYVEAELPELSRKYRAGAQYPISSSRGQDFPLTLAR